MAGQSNQNICKYQNLTMYTRYAMAMLGFMAVAIVNVLKCEHFAGPLLYQDGWQKLSSWFFNFPAYALILIPIGILAQITSAKWIMIGVISLNAIGAYLQEHSMTYGRFEVGAMATIVVELSDAALYPTMHVMISRWSPPEERSLISSIIYSGNPFGFGIALLLAPLHKNEIVYYSLAFLSAIWLILWYIFIESSPDEHTWFTSLYERTYIRKSLEGEIVEEGRDQQTISFWKYLCSKGFISTAFAHFGVSFTYVMLTAMQVYLPGSLPIMELQWTGNIIFPFIIIPFGVLISMLVRKHYISVTSSRKIATLISSTILLMALILSAMGGNSTKLFILNAIGGIGFGGVFSGTVISVIDIAPKYAGVLFAIILTIQILSTTFVLYVLHFTFVDAIHGGEPVLIWIFVGCTGLLLIITMMCYWRYGSAEESPWFIRGIIDTRNSSEAISLCETNTITVTTQPVHI